MVPLQTFASASSSGLPPPQLLCPGVAAACSPRQQIAEAEVGQRPSKRLRRAAERQAGALLSQDESIAGLRDGAEGLRLSDDDDRDDDLGDELFRPSLLLAPSSTHRVRKWPRKMAQPTQHAANTAAAVFHRMFLTAMVSASWRQGNKIAAMRVVDYLGEDRWQLKGSDGRIFEHSTTSLLRKRGIKPELLNPAPEVLRCMHYEVILRIPQYGRQKEIFASSLTLGEPIRFFRKFGAFRHLRAKFKDERPSDSGTRHYNPDESRGLLDPLNWLGIRWEVLRAKIKQERKKSERDEGNVRDDLEHDPIRSAIFFAVSWHGDEIEPPPPSDISQDKEPLEFEPLSAADARRSHIPDRVSSTCPMSCRRHFLCRCRSQESMAAFLKTPEADLLKNPVKYAKRLDLGFTDAKPTAAFEADQIREEEDLTSSRNGVVLSDGAGRIGLAAAIRVCKALGLSFIPAWFQARIGSCKGGWIVDASLGDELEIRRCQRKWDIDWAGCHKEDRVFEVKHWASPASARATFGDRLNAQLIAVLEAGGVPFIVFEKIQEQAVQSFEEERFVIGDAAEAMSALPPYREALENKTRLAIEMHDAGLNPFHEPAAMGRIVAYHGAMLKKIRDGAHYTCPETWRSRIAPDFEQRLKPLECIARLGGGYLQGDVLIARSPCNAPWDVQKLHALGHREVVERFGASGPSYLLDGLVVLSAHPDCTQAPADCLAGGDYDGDDVLLIAYSPLVQAFEPTAYDEGSVRSLVQKCESLLAAAAAPRDTTTAVAQAFHVGAMTSTLIGKLGNAWTSLADQRRVKDPATIDMGLLYQFALDGKLPPSLSQDDIRSKLLALPEWPAAPSWHPTAHLRPEVPLSQSVLGKLAAKLNIEEIQDEWRLEYGGRAYDTRDWQTRFEMPVQFQIPTRENMDELMNEIACAFRSYRSELSDLFNVCKTSREGQLQFAKARLEKVVVGQPYHPVEEQRARAVILYHVQHKEFVDRLHQGKQQPGRSVEWALQPAWEVCPKQLLWVAARYSGSGSVQVPPHALAPAVRLLLKYG